MNTDKTLADVQPGGRVRLGDQFSDWRFSEWWSGLPQDIGVLYPYDIAKLAWQAALSAQPSPGFQGVWPFVESPGEFTERLAAAMQEFDLLGAVRHVLIENPPVLAALQPVGEPVAWRYQPKDGLRYPAYTERYAQALAYDANPVPLYAAPPAQAVDLGPVIEEAIGCFNAAECEGWHEALAEGDIERIRDLWNRRIEFAYRSMIDSQAAGK